MLDLNHPQTEHIFVAARIEDEIRAHLVAMRDSSIKDKDARIMEITDTLIPKLHEMNNKHFGSAPGITNTLQRLESAVKSKDLQLSWKAFCALAEEPGENFGTCAI